MNMWETLSSRVLFKHSRLTIIEDDVLLPNGVRTKYLKFKDAGDAVTIICKRMDGRILLQKEYSYPTAQELYQFPGGSVPSGEAAEVGANRELMEEAKLRANTLQLLGTYFINNRRSSALMYVFLGTELEERGLEPDPEEIIQS